MGAWMIFIGIFAVGVSSTSLIFAAVLWFWTGEWPTWTLFTLVSMPVMASDWSWLIWLWQQPLALAAFIVGVGTTFIGVVLAR